MKPAGYILTSRELDEVEFFLELEHFVEYWIGQGNRSCDMLLGWEWGIRYYPTKEWASVRIVLTDLIEKVRRVEATGIGKLRNDDLWLTVAGCKFQFCHHGDIHLEYVDKTEHVRHFETRWTALGAIATSPNESKSV